jgi:hypothetical protein
MSASGYLLETTRRPPPPLYAFTSLQSVPLTSRGPPPLQNLKHSFTTFPLLLLSLPLHLRARSLLPRRQVILGAPGKNQEVEGRAHAPPTEPVLPHLLESRRIWNHSQTDAGSGEFPVFWSRVNSFLAVIHEFSRP